MMRKPRPSMPKWWWLGQDGCWFCRNMNNCNSCKAARMSGKYDPKLGHRRDKQQISRYHDWQKRTGGRIMQIKIKYHNPNMPKIEKIPNGDWIDLRAAETVELKQGEGRLISLGVSMKLPEGYEAHLAPRSSTLKNFGILMANSIGVIDESFCGPNDIWCFPALAMRKTIIRAGDRIAQFRIVKKMEPVELVEVDEMESPDRGGFGSTGVK